jgi:tetratricopeptide (TPR) repeat protein
VATAVMRWKAGLVVVVLVAALLGGQALAAASAPSGGTADAGGLIGRTGFAYLTGIRTFAAALLYQRLDPIGDAYYEGSLLAQKKYLIPSLYMVLMLDPQFEQAYYVAPWILLESGLGQEALALARRGVADNPRSGELRTSLAMVALREGRLDEAVHEADVARTLEWSDEAQHYTDLASVEAIYQHVGDHAKAEAVSKERARLEQPATPPSQ